MADEESNQYKDAVESGRRIAEPRADDIKAGLDKAHDAMAAGAWVGGTSDKFGTALGEQRTKLTTARTNALEEFDEEIRAQPEKVKKSDWRANWGEGRRHGGPEMY